MTIPTSPLSTVQDAAHLFRVSTKTIYRWIATGEIQATRVGPRLIRVDVDSVRSRPLQVTEADRG